jgi:hypothetical protein
MLSSSEAVKADVRRRRDRVIDREEGPCRLWFSSPQAGEGPGAPACQWLAASTLRIGDAGAVGLQVWVERSGLE